MNGTLFHASTAPARRGIFAGATMPVTPEPLFVGREHELAALDGALAQASEGRGSLWLVVGEAGIGKTRLLSELEARASVRGMTVARGSCWEAGGAPAYWPLIQALRGPLAGVEGQSLGALVGHGGPWLLSLLPELSARLPTLAPAPPLEPAQARFQLLDAVATLLTRLGEQAPVLLLLEDLHAADPSSLLMLELLAQRLRSAPLVVVGSARRVDAADGEAAALLARLAREATSLPLARLAEADVDRYLSAACGWASDDPGAKALRRAAEGRPLYLVETARLWLAHPEAASARAVPTSIKAAIRQRFAELSPEGLELLSVASAVGREFALASVVSVMGVKGVELASPLDEALAATLIEPREAGCFRFAHALFRDVLHQALPERRRWELHRRIAEAIEVAHEVGADLPWFELAHHWFEAGPDAADRAITASTRAAERALDQFAFDDAALSYARALALLDAQLAPDAHRRAELLLGRGRALLCAGRRDEGLACCHEVVTLARRIDDAELFARAALEYGATFEWAKVDPQRVQLFQDGLRMLPERDSSLRARLMARLAAAQQPAPDPEPPIVLARQAISMARRLGDDAALLVSLRYGCSAMMDLGDPRERLRLNHEHVALARRLGEPVDALRGTFRLVFDHFEVAEVATACDVIDASAAIARELGHPLYRWQVEALHAMRAQYRAEFDRAQDHRAEARRLAGLVQDPNASRALLLQQYNAAYWRGRADDVDALWPELAELMSPMDFGAEILRLLSVQRMVRIGDLERARRELRAVPVDMTIVLGDSSMLECLADAAVALGDEALARRLHHRLLPRRERLTSWGMFGCAWGPPVSRSLALLLACLGQHDAADDHFREALALSDATGGRAHAAWTAFEYGHFLAGRGARERANALLARAADEAGDLALDGLTRALETSTAGVTAGPSPAMAGTPNVAHLSLTNLGDTWEVSCEARSFTVRDSKGMRILARLVAEPGRELHVLDLVDAPPPGAHRDAGDAGEMLDEQARRQYRERVAALRAELQEAESFNDLGRGEHLRSEIEAIGRELSRAVGLGGRARRSGAAAERARVNVQRRLRDAIKRIAKHDPALEKHLNWAVKTGAFCRYDPS